MEGAFRLEPELEAVHLTAMRFFSSRHVQTQTETMDGDRCTGSCKARRVW